MKNNGFLPLAILFAVVMLVLSACGPDKEGDGQQSGAGYEADTSDERISESNPVESTGPEFLSEVSSETFSAESETDLSTQVNEEFSGLEVSSDLTDEGFGELITVPRE